MYKSKGRRPAAAIERYLGSETGLPALCAIGRSVQKVAREGLAAHRHPGFEICLLEQGAVDWFVGSRDISLRPGEVFFTPPHVLHGSRAGQLQPCVLCWLQVDSSRLRDRGLAVRLQRLAKSGSVHWPDSDNLLSCHAALLAECRHRRVDAPVLLAALLDTFLLRLARQGEAAVAARGTDRARTPAAVARAVAAIEAAPAQTWRVPTLAAVAGVGRSRLHALFVRHLGQSPADFALRARLRAAQELLSDRRRSITAVALELGFSSSQHFATAFRAQFGLTPSAYRRGAF